MMIIFSPKREFIFGDGFFHNLTVQGEHWHHPKMLVPPDTLDERAFHPPDELYARA
jgi:hypothetical protein